MLHFVIVNVFSIIEGNFGANNDIKNVFIRTLNGIFTVTFI